MKYTIEGFSQEAMLKFKKSIKYNDKGVEKERLIKLDFIDLVILRWIVDFYPSMLKYNINNKEYFKISYNYLIEELPGLNISKRGAFERLKKLVEFEILNQIYMPEQFTSYYSFGNNYILLVTNNRDINSNTRGNIDSLQKSESYNKTVNISCTQVQDSLHTSASNKSINNINNKLLSNSNKFELSNNSGSDEPSVCSDTFSVIENNPAMPSVYETTENKNNSACAQNVSARSNDYVDETHNCVDTSVEQSELDEINALKKFKSSQSTKHKKGEKKKTDNPFTRCLNVTNSKTQYNERVKNALYRFLQFRIRCAHTDETVWSSLLDSLEDCIKDAPTKDEGKLNILREKVIMNSLQGSYRKFFPLDAKSISTVLNNTFTDNNIINNGLNNTSSNPIGPIDSTKLALNPDGTPMIF